MSIQMVNIPANKIYFDRDMMEQTGQYEFTLDCGAVYFGAVYDNDGTLLAVDQYFYTQNWSRDDIADANAEGQVLTVDEMDFPAKSYMLSKEEDGNEWLRFHAIVPQAIDTIYFAQKYSD